MDRVLQFTEEQEKDGACILDVNMGMSGIDEKAMMLRTIDEVSGVTSLPLSLDSSHVEVLEAALRRYPGRALVNSVSLETEKFEKLLPIVKKYGAMFILLPLSDKGLPESLEEKKQIIDRILERAYRLGMEKEDVVVDGLVTTVGANRKAALETLETIRYCREAGLATICGLSNISFGMPERSYVNTAFLTLAIREGLTMAIANPSQELLVSCALAADLLLAKEDADIRYIEYTGTLAEKKRAREEQLRKQALVQAAGPEVMQEEKSGQGVNGIKTEGAGEAQAAALKRETVMQPVNPLQTVSGQPEVPAENENRYRLRHAVMKGNKNGIAAITNEALKAGEEPQALLNEVLLPAINEVGELFDRGKYFLPQLIGSA